MVDETLVTVAAKLPRELRDRLTTAAKATQTMPSRLIRRLVEVFLAGGERHDDVGGCANLNLLSTLCGPCNASSRCKWMPFTLAASPLYDLSVIATPSTAR